MLSDRELMEGILRGDESSFETFFARYRQAVRAYVAGMVRDESAAEDVVQEVFLRVWTKAEQWQETGEAKAWLFRIAANQAINHLRSVRRRRQQSLTRPTEGRNGEEMEMPSWMADGSVDVAEKQAQMQERRELLQRLCRQLPEAKRQVVHLVSQNEMNIREAAESLGVPEGTVKSRLYYAMRDMARELRDMGIEMEDI